MTEAWTKRALDLSAWALQHLINRTDRYGLYAKSGPRNSVASDGAFTLAKLRNHFKLKRILGAHANSDGDAHSKWACFDYDYHPGQANQPEPIDNMRSAITLYEELKALGMSCLLEDSNGLGGYHVWVLFAEPQPSKEVVTFAAAAAAKYGVIVPEYYPPSPSNEPGAWVRIPGKHHTQDHISRIWDGEAWREGEDAIRLILAVTGGPMRSIDRDDAAPKAPWMDAEYANKIKEGDLEGAGVAGRDEAVKGLCYFFRDRDMAPALISEVIMATYYAVLAPLGDTGWDQSRCQLTIDSVLREMPDKKKAGGAKRKTAVDAILDMVLNDDEVSLFYDKHLDAPLITYPFNSHRETWPLASREFKEWAAGKCWEDHGKIATDTAVRDAIVVLSSEARKHEGRAYYKVARYDSALYYDLGGEEWTAVKVTENGWEVVAEPAVRFYRRSGQLALPDPEPGGKITALRKFLNITDEDFPLLVGWLLMSMQPDGTYPLLVVNGMQGSGKSTLTRYIKHILDPAKTTFQASPKSVADMGAISSSAWILAFDNMASVKHEMSDVLCGVASGTSFGERELYTNFGYASVNVKRPLILNGIGEIVTRGDILDRAIVLTLPPIQDKARKRETELEVRFHVSRAKILGALFDGLAEGLRREDTVKADMMRLADFAAWTTACETKYWEEGVIVKRMKETRAGLQELVLESETASKYIIRVARRGKWTGSFSELHALLQEEVDNMDAYHHTWPKSPHFLTTVLSRIAPALEHHGIIVEMDQHTRQVTIQGKKVPKRTKK